MLKALKPFAGPAALFALQWGLKMGDIGGPFLGGVLVGAAVFWFFLALLSNRTLLKQLPGILEWMPFLDPTGGFAASDQLTGRFIQGQTLHVSSVQHDGAIRGRHFEDCDIYGPAVLFVTGIGHMVECSFDGSLESTFILVEQRLITGPILVEDCTFKQCRFHRIGFIGRKEMRDKFLEGTKTEPASAKEKQSAKASEASP